MGISSTLFSYTGEGLRLNSRSDLPAAIRLTESLRKAQRPWPPVNTEEDISGKGLVGVMDDELGFVD